MHSNAVRELKFKVSPRSEVSVSGFGRFPVTLYYEQWVRLLAAEAELRRTSLGKIKSSHSFLELTNIQFARYAPRQTQIT